MLKVVVRVVVAFAGKTGRELGKVDRVVVIVVVVVRVEVNV